MLETIVFFGLIGLALLIRSLWSKIGAMEKRLEESTTRHSDQMHAVYDALKSQEKLLTRVLGTSVQPLKGGVSRPSEPAEHAASELTHTDQPAPETEPATEILQPVRPVPAPSQPIGQIPVTGRPSGVPNTLATESVGQLASAMHELRERHAGPASPPEPRVPGRFEAAARDVLKRIWSWIVVGEEHIPKGVSVEFAIASQWLLRIGIVLLVLGVSFFLKYSIEHGMLSQLARVVLSVIAGLVMLIAGIRILGGSFHVMGQGLLGGGIATLYFSAFAAANLYHLIEMPAGFAAMIVVTALSGLIAVRFHSMLTAILGVVGGYATPYLLSTGVVNFPGLYGYMLVLGLGVIGVCAYKRWPLLNYLSFVGNYALVVGSLQQYEPASHFWQVMPFLIAFFVLFSTMVFIYNLKNRTKSNLLDVLVLFLNAGVFFCLSFWTIRGSFDQKWVASVTLGLAAFYVAHVWYCLVRRILDRELMLSFTALSAFFLAITVPILLSKEWITVSWAVQALVMLWVAGKLESEFLRHVSYLLYLIVIGRFAFIDLPSQYSKPGLADLPLTDYLQQLAQRLIMFGVPVGSLALGYRQLVKPSGATPLAIDKAIDIAGWVREQKMAKVAAFVMFGMLFLYMHLELNRTLGTLFPPLRLPVLTLLWLTVCVLLVSEFARSANRIVLVFLGLFVLGVISKLLIFDLAHWSATLHFLYDGPYRMSDAGFRLLDFGAVIVFFAFAARLLMSQTTMGHPILARQAGTLMGIAGVAMLFLYTTLEVNSFLYHYVEKLRYGGVSILWTLFALAFLIRGIGRNDRSLRYAGLVLFGIVTWKVFFVDLARLDQLYRIVAFIILGVLVLFGSFLYLRSRHSFLTADSTGGTDPLAESASQPPTESENEEQL